MARRSEGQVVERHWKSGRGYALRFRAYGERQYLTLGLEAEGWDRKRAEEELANVMADVRRGLWTPPTRRPVRGVTRSERRWRSALRPFRAPGHRPAGGRGQRQLLPHHALGSLAPAALLR